MFSFFATSDAIDFGSDIAAIAILNGAASTLRGRPPILPLALAAAKPAFVRSTINSLFFTLTRLCTTMRQETKRSKHNLALRQSLRFLPHSCTKSS
jgi:hypothetical protein